CRSMIQWHSAPGANRDKLLAAPRIFRKNVLEGDLMFKQLSLALMIGVLAIALTACGGRKEDEEEEAPPAKSGAAASTGAAAPAPANAAAPAAAPAAGGATITGKVTFAGTAPQNELIKMDADAYCKAAHSTPVYGQEVEVNGNGTLKDVLVFVKEGVTGSYPAPSTPVTLDQQGC